MSDEDLESPEAPADEYAADPARSRASWESRRDAAPSSAPRIGTALSVLWWDERAPSSGE